MNSDLHICFCIDNNFAPFMATAIASLLCNAPPKKYKLCLHVLDGGISSENKSKIRELSSIAPFEINYIKIDERLTNSLPESITTIPSIANARLFLASLLPDLDKVIYLDSDVIILGNVADLWNINIDQFYIAAVREFDCVPTKFITAFPQLKEGYFNAGIYIANLKSWRDNDLEIVLSCNSNKYNKFLAYADQDLLNLTMQKNTLYLDPSWNANGASIYDFDYTHDNNLPAIRHWVGVAKPWDCPLIKYADYFWKYAQMTSFYSDIQKYIKTYSKQDYLKASLKYHKYKLKFKIRKDDQSKRRMLQQKGIVDHYLKFNRN